MARRKQLSGTVVHQLPPDIDMRRIKAYAALTCGIGRAWGETYLLVHNDKLVILTRSSVFDDYDQLELRADIKPRLERGSSVTDLYVTDSEGTEQRLPVKPAELKAVERVLRVLEQLD